MHLDMPYCHRRTGAFGIGEGGGGDLTARKKITQCPKACVVQTHSNRSKSNLNVNNSYV